MTLTQELASWGPLTQLAIASPPTVGNKAPSEPNLVHPGQNNGKPTVVAFLRHCGCPVAEASFRNLRDASTAHPDINFIAISHSSQSSTDKWVEALGGTGPSLTVLVDSERQIYAKWGLGVVSWSHVLSPSGLMGIWKLGKEKGIWNRPTESGSRWQAGGAWAVDEDGLQVE
ncbi:hypothetical protein PDE_06449 [Penicillium oxalicum 114-2]|uniref:Alkyl hydroperoxide reductase subunit C/ Thiol specific antioxidant domain-containing protein n=1 Tax=Penicillium oxalicum (strain 114-2 / CGMCC 5302) TaxID=933388 RepID=S7ZMC3_PENO1|nr:hypothetical protein PDE_06449 [Penicillium oxalicum 114-2]